MSRPQSRGTSSLEETEEGGETTMLPREKHQLSRVVRKRGLKTFYFAPPPALPTTSAAASSSPERKDGETSRNASRQLGAQPKPSAPPPSASSCSVQARPQPRTGMEGHQSPGRPPPEPSKDAVSVRAAANGECVAKSLLAVSPLVPSPSVTSQANELSCTARQVGSASPVTREASLSLSTIRTGSPLRSTTSKPNPPLATSQASSTLLGEKMANLPLPASAEVSSMSSSAIQARSRSPSPPLLAITPACSALSTITTSSANSTPSTMPQVSQPLSTTSQAKVPSSRTAQATPSLSKTADATPALSTISKAIPAISISAGTQHLSMTSRGTSSSRTTSQASPASSAIRDANTKRASAVQASVTSSQVSRARVPALTTSEQEQPSLTASEGVTLSTETSRRGDPEAAPASTDSDMDKRRESDKSKDFETSDTGSDGMSLANTFVSSIRGFGGKSIITPPASADRAAGGAVQKRPYKRRDYSRPSSVTPRPLKSSRRGQSGTPRPAHSVEEYLANTKRGTEAVASITEGTVFWIKFSDTKEAWLECGVVKKVHSKSAKPYEVEWRPYDSTGCVLALNPKKRIALTPRLFVGKPDDFEPAAANDPPAGTASRSAFKGTHKKHVLTLPPIGSWCIVKPDQPWGNLGPFTF